MADEKEAEDLDLGEEKSGKSKLLIIIIAAAVLLIGGGVAAYFLLLGDDGEGEESTEVSEASEEEVAVEQGPVEYLALDPAFVVTLPGKPSLLQVGVSVRYSSAGLTDFLTHNDPMIRHNLLNLLSTVDAKTLKDRAPKESLQKRMLDELNRVLKELKAPGKVEALYFTSFVTQ